MIGGYNPWFCEELIRRIKNDVSETSLQLARGCASDFASYRNGCGFVEGLERAIEYIEEIQKEMDRK